MAVRQYIGAKYVPHGWTDWNAQTLYDPLYIVKYNLGWYILKKPLPQAGVLPTNEEYWALVDNWNGQVEEYRKEVIGLSKEMYDIKERINALYPPEGLTALIPNDASVDNTTAFQLLENYCADNDIDLFIPQGRYYFSGTVTKAPKVSWYGSSGTNGTTPSLGIRGTILEYTGAGNFIEYPANSSNTYFEYAGLHNLNIRGNNNGEGVGLYIKSGNRQLVFEYVTIVEFSTGLYAQGAGELYLTNVFIRECKYSVNLANSSDSWFYACAFGAGKFLPQYSGMAFQASGCTSLNFIACRFQHQLGGSGCLITNGEGAIFTGCIFDGNEQSGLILNGGEEYIVNGCRFYDNPTHAIVLQGTITNVVIDGNYVKTADLICYGSPTNIVITNNILKITSSNVLSKYVVSNNIGVDAYKEFTSTNTNLNEFVGLEMAVFGAASTADITVTLPTPSAGKILRIRKGAYFTNAINLSYQGEIILSAKEGINTYMFTGTTWIEI